MSNKIILITFLFIVSCTPRKTTVNCGDTVVVYFKISNLDGTRIDASERLESFIEKDRPFSFVSCNNEIIKGWDNQIEGNTLGGDYQIKVSCADAYGEIEIDRDLEANSDLIITYKIIDIK